jgi:hypothetical protein
MPIRVVRYRPLPRFFRVKLGLGLAGTVVR